MEVGYSLFGKNILIDHVLLKTFVISVSRLSSQIFTLK